jgi:hypothetical protein
MLTTSYSVFGPNSEQVSAHNIVGLLPDLPQNRRFFCFCINEISYDVVSTRHYTMF